MKNLITTLMVLAALPAMGANRTPLNNAFLQSNLDLNGYTITNGMFQGIATVQATNAVLVDMTNYSSVAGGRVQQPTWFGWTTNGGRWVHYLQTNTTVTMLNVVRKQAADTNFVYYLFDDYAQALSLRVAGPADGNTDPRMTLAFLNNGDELDRTYSFHTNNLQIKYAGSHQSFVWQDNYLDGSITYGNTNTATKMQGSNITFMVGNSTTALQALNIQSNRNIQIGGAGHEGKLEFWDDSGGSFSGAGIGFDSAQSSMRIYVTGLIIDGNSSFNGIVFMPQGTSIGGGATLLKMLSATAALDFPNTSAQSSSDLTITVSGAATGDTVMLGVPTAAIVPNADYTAWVSGANTVTVRFNNYSAGAQNPTSGTFRAQVNHF